MTFPEPLVFFSAPWLLCRRHARPTHPAGSLPLKNSSISEADPEDQALNPLYFIADASFHSCSLPRLDTRGPSAAQTHQLCRVPEPGAQAAEFPGSFPSHSQGPPREREDAAAGPVPPAGRAVVPRAEQVRAAGRGAGLGSEATADLQRERDLSDLGETNWHILGDEVALE